MTVCNVTTFYINKAKTLLLQIFLPELLRDCLLCLCAGVLHIVVPGQILTFLNFLPPRTNH